MNILNTATMSFGTNKYLLPDSNLNYCVQDSLDMRQFFQEQLTVPEGSCAVLWDKDCTKAGMVYGLGLLTQNAPRLDRCLLSISGHGYPQSNPDEPDGQEGAIVCHDAAELADGSLDPDYLLTETEFREALAVIPDTCLFEAWLDVCFAGESADRFWKPQYPGYRVRSIIPRKRNIRPLLHRVVQDRFNENTVVWASSHPDQPSAEGYFQGKGNGAFTWAFLKMYEPDMPRGVLLEKVAQRLKAEGYSQVPMLQCSEKLRALPVGVK